MGLEIALSTVLIYVDFPLEFHGSDRMTGLFNPLHRRQDDYPYPYWLLIEIHSMVQIIQIFVAIYEGCPESSRTLPIKRALCIIDH